jgi:hypothetical protein
MARKIVKIKAAKKVRAKKTLIIPWEYLLVEVVASDIQTLQDKCNEVGMEGWNLLFSTPVTGPPEAERMWFTRPKET